ncbi:Glutaminyl-tRNA synthetase [Clarireedia jacksonii]
MRLLVDFQSMQREFGGLNLTSIIMSKRDIRNLIEKKMVRGWDDPHLCTLKAIQRRGIPPGALLSFIFELGVTTAMTFVDNKRFEQKDRRSSADAIPIKAVSFTKDKTTGTVTEIKVVFGKEDNKPKTYIQWVPEGSPKAEVRIHLALFESDQPGLVDGGFMNDVNLDSETT